MVRAVNGGPEAIPAYDREGRVNTFDIAIFCILRHGQEAQTLKDLPGFKLWVLNFVDVAGIAVDLAGTSQAALAPVEVAIATILPCFWIYRLTSSSFTSPAVAKK